jgi:hypothetical protein
MDEDLSMGTPVLSERKCSGTPRITITLANAEITFALGQLRSQPISRHSRVYSSIRFNIRTVRPSCVFTLTKS